jgi:polysaccharide export outer membrane protein
MSRFFSLFFFAVCSSCGNLPYRGCEVLGADDFVIDSYRLAEGKWAILEMEGKCLEPFGEELFQFVPDQICEGDFLQIALYHPVRTDLSQATGTIGANGFEVRQGAIELPDLPPICVVGLSLQEAKAKIQSTYAEQIQNVEIFLSYKKRPHHKVDLIGLVEIPCILLQQNMTLFEVLSVAKISPSSNLFRSYVVRQEKLLPVDLERLIRQGDMSQNIAMHPGDKIYIADPSASPIMVLGEVGREGVVDLLGGTMTLSRAIAEAGGIPYSGDKRYIQVIRGHLLSPKIYTLRWEHIVALPSQSLLLMPGDIVYVAAKPIVEWNRFVNQILPTLVGLDLLHRGAQNVGITLP